MNKNELFVALKNKNGGAIPNFKGRFSYNEDGITAPIRAYLHKSFFGISSSLDMHFTQKVKENLLSQMNFNKEILRDADYFIAAIWKDQDSKTMADIFKYSDTKNWPGNPDMKHFVFRDGFYVPEEIGTCGDTLIILGEEEKYRRTTKDLIEYMENPPEISGLISVF